MYTKISIYLRLFKLKAPIPSGVLRINTSIMFFFLFICFYFKGYLQPHFVRGKLFNGHQ